MADEFLWVLVFVVAVVAVVAVVWLRSDRIARKVRGAVERGQAWVEGTVPMHDRNFYVLLHIAAFVVVAISYVFILLPWVGAAWWVLSTSLSAYAISTLFNLVERWYDRCVRQTRTTKVGDFPALPWIPNFKTFAKRYVGGNPVTGVETALQDQEFVSSSTGDLEHWPRKTGHRTHPIVVSPKLPDLRPTVDVAEGAKGEKPTVTVTVARTTGARTPSGIHRGSEHYLPAKPHLYLLGSEEWAHLTDDPAIKAVLLALDPDVRRHIRTEYTWAKPTTLVLMAHDLLRSWEKEISGPRAVLANVEADLEDARRQADYYKSQYEDALELGKLGKSATRED